MRHAAQLGKGHAVCTRIILGILRKQCREPDARRRIVARIDCRRANDNRHAKRFLVLGVDVILHGLRGFRQIDAASARTISTRGFGKIKRRYFTDTRFLDQFGCDSLVQVVFHAVFVDAEFQTSTLVCAVINSFLGDDCREIKPAQNDPSGYFISGRIDGHRHRTRQSAIEFGRKITRHVVTDRCGRFIDIDSHLIVFFRGRTHFSEYLLELRDVAFASGNRWHELQLALYQLQ